MRVFHFVIKKRKRALRPDFFFFYFPSWSLFPKCFCGFSILVCIGVQVFFRGLFFSFFSPPLARDSLSHSPRACLRSAEKRWKIAFVLQIQAFSMKLRVHGFLFLVFLRIKTDGKNKIFLLPHQHSDKKVFLGVSQEWKLWKILPDNNPNWNEHSFSGLLPGDVS